MEQEQVQKKVQDVSTTDVYLAVFLTLNQQFYNIVPSNNRGLATFLFRYVPDSLLKEYALKEGERVRRTINTYRHLVRAAKEIR